MREQLAHALRAAAQAEHEMRSATLRLISAAIKDRDAEMRTENDDAIVSDTEILSLLKAMVAQREESVKRYEEGGRLELAERERAEIAVIREFIPQPMSAEETNAAVDAAIAEQRAEGIRDIGRVLAALKAKHAGQMDFAAAGERIKAQLSN